jgi:hypothetical protein
VPCGTPHAPLFAAAMLQSDGTSSDKAATPAPTPASEAPPPAATAFARRRWRGRHWRQRNLTASSTSCHSGRSLLDWIRPKRSAGRPAGAGPWPAPRQPSTPLPTCCLCPAGSHAVLRCAPTSDARPPPPLPAPRSIPGGKWNSFAGQAGKSYTLYTDGSGARLDSTFGAGGLSGKATFIRAVAFRGNARVTARLAKNAQGKWVLQGEGGDTGWRWRCYCSRLPRHAPPVAVQLASTCPSPAGPLHDLR